MPRDSTGNWVYSAGNPVTTGTTIASAWWNNTYNDIGSSIGASLDRTGNTGGMTGQLKLYTTGTSAAVPAVTFDAEPNSGLYWAGVGDVRLSLLGTDLVKWTNAGTNIYLSSLTVTGTSPNGRGGTFTATGAEQGVVGTGGSGAGNAGTWGISGGATGIGAIGQGVSGSLGLYAYSSATNVDVARVDGYVDLSHATNPASTTGFTNHLTPKNIAKAFVSFSTNGSGGVTVADAFNVTGVTLGLNDSTITFASAMADTNYTVVGTAGAGQPFAFYVQTKNTGSVLVRVMTFASPGTPLGPTTNSFSVNLAVFGAQ